MSVKSLSQLAIKEKAIIEAIEGHDALQIRLQELGLVPGTLVSIKRYAPFGDPMELEIRGYCLSIRKADADCVMVRTEEGAGK
ncbi:MAG: ferrous iron transport protein A [Candidatus Omnitrophica bacterium]|nr:ferrous iron transport protein A [Candidatus Omnitrophota bacterium]